MGCRDLFIWLGGHDPVALREEPRENTQPIVMNGALIAWASLISGGSWSLAAHGFADGPTKQIAAALGFVAGSLFVMTFDRGVLYWMDTTFGNPVAKVAYLAMRIAIVYALSQFTVAYLAPFLLGPELDARAQELADRIEEERADRVKNEFSLQRLETEESNAIAAVANANQAVNIVPANIDAQLKQGKDCSKNNSNEWAKYNREVYAYNNEKSTYTNVSESSFGIQRADYWRTQQGERLVQERDRLVKQQARLSKEDKRCVSIIVSANKALMAYREQINKALEEAIARRKSTQQAFSQAQSNVNAQLSAAARQDQRGYTSQSATVLQNLIDSDPGARWKWNVCRFLLAALELLPLLLKISGEMSVPGMRLALDRSIASGQHKRLRIKAFNADDREMKIGVAMDQAMDAALASPTVHRQMAAEFEIEVRNAYPPYGCENFISEIEMSEEEVRSAKPPS